MKVYVTGNPLIKEDKAALQLLPLLKKRFPHVEFEEIEGVEEIEEGEVILIDVGINVERPMVVDIDRLEIDKRRISLHDFDVALGLLILKRLGKIKKCKIIALPPSLDENDAERIFSLLSSLL